MGVSALPHEGYQILLDLCKEKGEDKYFVFTSNVDGVLERTGFKEDRMYSRQGSYKYLQCVRGK